MKVTSNDLNQISFKKNIKSITPANKNHGNFSQSKENFNSTGRRSNEGTPSKYLLDGNKLIDSLTNQKLSSLKIIKNGEQGKKLESNLNKMSQNQKSFSNLKVTNALESFKVQPSNGGNNSSNANSVRTSSNFNKNGQAPIHLKKNSENLFLVKNNSNLNLNVFNNANNAFEKASFSQIRQEQFNKTGNSKIYDYLNPESERNVKSKHEHLFRSDKSPLTKKNNNFFSANSTIEEKKSELPNLHSGTIEESDLKKWLNDKTNHNNQSNDELQRSLRVTLNKNFSKANLLSSKLYENSQQQQSQALKNSNSTGAFPKIKSGVPQEEQNKRESSPLSDSDSMKISRQQVKNKKISIDDRKTNSVSQKKEEFNSSKYGLESRREAKEKNENQVSNYIKVFTVKSRAGMNYDGARKTNQDNFIAKTNLLNLDDYHIFGVFDGHGLHGHFVSATVKQFFTEFYNRLELYSNKTFKFSKSTVKESLVYDRLKESDYEFVKNSFIRCEQELTRAKFEVNFSGTTSVVILMIGNKLIVANAGDSRAIMVINKKNKTVTEDSEDKDYEPLQLSRDHKPDLEDEKERIIACNGRVDKYTDNGIKSGPFRVWLKNENFPGLAMSRSIGDFVAGSVGCICEPEITEFELSHESKFIIIASDGVWEFLSNKRVMEIVLPYYRNNDPAGAAERLIEESTRCWKKEDDVIDDITCVIIFLNKL